MNGNLICGFILKPLKQSRISTNNSEYFVNTVEISVLIIIKYLLQSSKNIYDFVAIKPITKSFCILTVSLKQYNPYSIGNRVSIISIIFLNFLVNKSQDSKINVKIVKNNRPSFFVQALSVANIVASIIYENFSFLKYINKQTIVHKYM